MKITIINDSAYLCNTEAEELLLKRTFPDLTISCVNRDSIDLEKIDDSEVIFGWVPAQLLKELRNLKWLHLPSAGANNYANLSLYANQSIILTKSSGTFGMAIAEHTLGMMLALSRKFAVHLNSQHEGEWRFGQLDVQEITGSNVLVLGLGNLGTEICKHLSGFGCHITGFRRDATVSHDFVNEVRPISRLRESLPEADYIVICLPATNETTKLIGQEEIALMKKRAIIVNVGRGSIIDTDALIDALNNKRIAGAGLDVTDPEPLPPGHPLWSAENVMITPHVSAVSSGNTVRIFSIFSDLLKLYASGQPMFNVIDFESGY